MSIKSIMRKYNRIIRDKLTEKGKVVYDKLAKATNNFKDKKAVKINKAVLDRFYDRVKTGLPHALKSNHDYPEQIKGYDKFIKYEYFPDRTVKKMIYGHHHVVNFNENQQIICCSLAKYTFDKLKKKNVDGHEYFKNGKLKYCDVYHTKFYNNGILNQASTIFKMFRNGQLKFIESDVSVKEWYKNGILKKHRNFVKGINENYFRDGKLKPTK